MVTITNTPKAAAKWNETKNYSHNIANRHISVSNLLIRLDHGNIDDPKYLLSMYLLGEQFFFLQLFMGGGVMPRIKDVIIS